MARDLLLVSAPVPFIEQVLAFASLRAEVPLHRVSRFVCIFHINGEVMVVCRLEGPHMQVSHVLDTGAAVSCWTGSLHFCAVYDNHSAGSAFRPRHNSRLASPRQLCSSVICTKRAVH